MHTLHGTTQVLDSVHTFLTAITQACSSLFGYILMKSSTDRGTRVANEREISTMIGAPCDEAESNMCLRVLCVAVGNVRIQSSTCESFYVTYVRAFHEGSVASCRTSITAAADRIYEVLNESACFTSPPSQKLKF